MRIFKLSDTGEELPGPQPHAAEARGRLMWSSRRPVPQTLPDNVDLWSDIWIPELH